jgi:hypothetical protein
MGTWASKHVDSTIQPTESPDLTHKSRKEPDDLENALDLSIFDHQFSWVLLGTWDNLSCQELAFHRIYRCLMIFVSLLKTMWKDCLVIIIPAKTFKNLL